MIPNPPLVRRLLITTVAVAVALSVTPAGANAAPTDSYRYPVNPGTAAWAALPNHAAMERVTQLPEKTLARMSTDRLAGAVLDYPLLMDAIAFNDVQQGFEIVASRFNGLQELLRRPDAGDVLLHRYQRFDARIPSTFGELQAGDHSWNLWKHEILLAQPSILAGLTPAEQERLLRAGRDKYAAKQANAGVYGQSGLDHTAVVLGRTLAVREGWDYRQSRLLREAFAPVADAGAVATAVDRHFAAPGDLHVVDDGLSIQDYAGTVYTPRGTAVAVTVTTYELTSSQITSANNAAASQYPQATRKANASRRYNCHSFAWYSSSSSNIRWMNTPGDDKY